MMANDPDPSATEQFRAWMRVKNYAWPRDDVGAQRDILDEYLLEVFQMRTQQRRTDPSSKT